MSTAAISEIIANLKNELFEANKLFLRDLEVSNSNEISRKPIKLERIELEAKRGNGILISNEAHRKRRTIVSNRLFRKPIFLHGGSVRYPWYPWEDISSREIPLWLGVWVEEEVKRGSIGWKARNHVSSRLTPSWKSARAARFFATSSP